MRDTSTTVEKLEIIDRLLDALHDEGIVYCHWKSNEHLNASMTGDTDLDVLFDVRQQTRLERILEELDFKKFEPVKEKTYKDIVDYIGFDKETGKVVHLHTHYRLTLGEAYLKGYQLDIEPMILGSRHFNEEFGIYCIDPHFEQVLLFIRESLKIRRRDRFKHLLGIAKANANAVRECRWLQERTNYRDLYSTIRKMFRNADAVYRIISVEMTFANLSELSSIVRDEFSSKRLYSPLVANLTRWYREVRVKLARLLARVLNQPVLSRRTNPRGGVIIAVIGADGSGKSTVTESLRQTFDKKLDVFKVYFGRGDGHRSPFRRALQRFKNLFVRTSRKEKVLNNVRPDPKNIGGLRLAYKCLEAITVALEKKSNLRLIESVRRQGGLVICDRYPQNQFMGFNDGPLLHHLLQSGNVLLRLAARYEQQIYASCATTAPDVVIKLIADADVVEARKPNETRLDLLIEKIEAIKALRVNPCSKVVTVDAVLPLQTVIQTVKNVTWNAL